MPKPKRPAVKTTYFYILRCKDRTLYCGVTTDLARREAMHNSGRGSAYVRSRGGGKIIYSERFRSMGKALSREAAVKRLPRRAKLAMVLAARALKNRLH
jgi:putative endonuclease